MMRAILAIGLILTSLVALAQDGRVFRLVFSKTDVAQVLQAVSLRTGTNIVYSGKSELPITVNLSATNAEEAVRGVASAAGLVYRRLGDTFVVAAADDMRKALMPYGYRVRFTLKDINAEETAKALQASYRDIVAEPAGDKLYVHAVTADIPMVRRFIEEREAAAAASVAVNEIVAVRNADPAQLAAVLKNLYPGLSVDVVGKEGGGSLVLKGAAADIRQARQTISILDVVGGAPATDERIQIYEIRYSSAPVLKKFLTDALPELKVTVGPESYSPRAPGFRPLTGATLDGGRAGGAGGGGGGGGVFGGQGGGQGGANQGVDLQGPVQDGEKAKQIILRGPSRTIEMALDLLSRLDVEPEQVMVQVQVVDTSPERLETLGFRWNWTSFDAYEVPRGTLIDDTRMSTTRPPGFGQFSRIPWNITSVLDALITQREAKLLANPQVRVIEGDDANIFIGDTIRARLAQANGLGGQTIDIVEFPVGIVLLIRPRVNADGNITMRVRPVVSSITAIDSDNVPQTSVREAETTVMVKDGETVVIGGLIRDEMSKTVREVPLLSQLPLVGELFRSRSTSRRKSEVLVFITVKRVSSMGEKPKG